MAEKIQITPNHVGVLERGETVPSLETVYAYSKAFGVTMGELLDAGPTSDKWLRQVVTIARAVPPAKRSFLLTILAGVVVALSRHEEDGKKKTGAEVLQETRTAVDELITSGLDFTPDDPRLTDIIDLLRNKDRDQLERALAVLRAMGK